MTAQQKQIGFLLPVELADAFDAYVSSRGGRAETLRRLIERALAENGDQVPERSRHFDPDNPLSGEFAVSFPRDDVEKIRTIAKLRKMTVPEWIRVTIQGHVRGHVPFNKYERMQIGRVLKELRGISISLSVGFKRILSPSATFHDQELFEHAIPEFSERVELMIKTLKDSITGDDNGGPATPTALNAKAGRPKGR